MENSIEEFNEECVARIRSNAGNTGLQESSQSFIKESIVSKYTYNFNWLGRPIIQYPQDMIALQEIIWRVQPDLIIETGVAHGGSLIFFASMLELIGKNADVLGIDIEIHDHNKTEIIKNPMSKRITLIEGSSISDDVVQKVQKIIQNKSSILVVLDSYHSHEHVLEELKLYTPFVTINSYCIVFDTYIDNYTEIFNKEYSYHCWDGDNPYTAISEFLRDNTHFEVDEEIQNKLLITSAPDGYLKRVR